MKSSSATRRPGRCYHNNRAPVARRHGLRPGPDLQVRHVLLTKRSALEMVLLSFFPFHLLTSFPHLYLKRRLASVCWVLVRPRSCSESLGTVFLRRRRSSLDTARYGHGLYLRRRLVLDRVDGKAHDIGGSTIMTCDAKWAARGQQ
ncbi:hypothetical protein TPAR_00921 [Tolypocladium paradoxum]|uniref:Uncharacterized protein n=1 Tax=Tolypocladium paradoxum TaxID=94208 RepID=A0A2S4L8W2_9HYPO|nr:hypothetical protein TPAR_00921 [Tolypocladium paradoxum]